MLVDLRAVHQGHGYRAVPGQVDLGRQVSCPFSMAGWRLRLMEGDSFDDGPSDYTADLLNFFDDQKIKSTMFIVGSRVSYLSCIQSRHDLDLWFVIGHFTSDYPSSRIYGRTSTFDAHLVPSSP